MTLFHARAATKPKPLVASVTICLRISLWSFFFSDGCIFSGMRILYQVVEVRCKNKVFAILLRRIGAISNFHYLVIQV